MNLLNSKIFEKKLKLIKILFIIFPIFLIFLISTNFLNFNNRVYNYFFKTILLLDQNIFKEHNMISNNNKLTFLIVGHTYNFNNEDEISRDETHPTVSKFIKNQHQKQHIDYIFYLGDLVQKTNVNSILKVDKEISSYNKNFIKVIGNHDVHPLSYLLGFFRGQSSYFVSEFGENILVFLNTNFKVADVDKEQLKFIKNILNKKSFKNIIFFSHHVIWTSQKKNFPFVNNNSINLRTSNHNFHKFIDKILLNKNKNRIVVISGDMGNNAPYIFKKNNNIEYYAIGFGNNKLFLKNFAYGSALKIELSKKGLLSIDKMTIN